MLLSVPVLPDILKLLDKVEKLQVVNYTDVVDKLAVAAHKLVPVIFEAVWNQTLV